MADEGLVEIELTVTSEDDPEELVQWLKENGATDVEVTTPQGFLPVVPIVIAAVIAVGTAVEAIEKVRLSHMPQQIIEHRDGKLHVTVMREIKNGKIIILGLDNKQIAIENPPKLLDLTEVAKTAATKSVDAAVALVKKAKGSVTVENQPARSKFTFGSD